MPIFISIKFLVASVNISIFLRSPEFINSSPFHYVNTLMFKISYKKKISKQKTSLCPNNECAHTHTHKDICIYHGTTAEKIGCPSG